MRKLCFDFCRYQNIAFFFLCIIFAPKVFCQSTYDYNQQVKSCYNLIIDLKITAAKEKIEEIRKANPHNLAILHLENYIDFFILFISEDINEYNKRIKQKSYRLDYLENIKSNSPYHKFVKAEILLQWALIHIKFDDKVKAGSNVYEAYNLLESNKKQFPKFIDNNKSLSIIHALAESVPKWVRSVIGVNGSIVQAKKEIEEIADYALANKEYMYREEVASIYSYILFYQLNQKDRAIKELDAFNLNHKNSPLIAFLKASMYLRNGSNDKCLSVLTDLNIEDGQHPFHYLQFMKGRSLLFKQNEGCDKYMIAFVNKFKGRHFIKEAYQKLAWYELSVNNNIGLYKKYMALCSSKGNELVDEDKQAMKEARSNVIPNATLLKARILFDGGYFSQALTVLVKNEASLMDNPKTIIEFNYRIGRIFQALRNYKEAIQYLNNTISKGGNESYFAANAALQIGFIYEDLKQSKNAITYYEKCLKMNPSEYKNSMHQKAKSGVQRLKK